MHFTNIKNKKSQDLLSSDNQLLNKVVMINTHIFAYGHENIKAIFNTLKPGQDVRHFPDDIFKCNFLNENVQILIKVSLKFVPKGPINNIPTLVQIMAWHRPGDKPLSEPMMVSLLMHICFTRSQWVNNYACSAFHMVPWLHFKMSSANHHGITA